MSSATTEIIANAPNIPRKIPIPVPPEFGGSGTTTSTGTGSVVLSNNPVLVTPNLGTPSAVVLTHGTGLVPSSGLAATGTPSSSTFLRGDNSWATAIVPVTGSWVPSPRTGSGITFSGVSANYTKIGNMVFAYTQLTINATSDTSNIAIQGLPVASANANYVRAAFSVAVSGSFSNSFIGEPLVNDTALIVLNGFNDNNVTWATLSGSTLKFMCIYSTT